MSKKILITRKIPDKTIKILEEKGYLVDMNNSDNILSQRQIIKLLSKKSYDATITLLTDKIDGAVYDSASSVKLYANYATGFDNIDLEEAEKRGITITNAPAPLATDAVAEYTVSLIFSLGRRIVEADEFVRRGKYKGWSAMNFIGSSVFDKTLGIIGAGRIGAQTARHCNNLGMKIIYTDVVRNENLEKNLGAKFFNSVEEVIKEADIVSLHTPLLESTRHLINKERLSLMKPESLLINTSRGQIIDEKALEQALEKKVIKGAALDVFEFEPKISRKLRSLKNVIITPHIASASEKARDQMAEIVANNVIDFFEGKTPRNIISK